MLSAVVSFASASLSICKTPPQVILESPLSISPKLLDMAPESRVATLVNDEVTTPEPNVFALNTEVLLILNIFPDCKLKFSEDVQFSEFQSIDLSVAPFKIIPPPAAVNSVGLSTVPISIFLSSTVNVVELIVV